MSSERSRSRSSAATPRSRSASVQPAAKGLAEVLLQEGYFEEPLRSKGVRFESENPDNLPPWRWRKKPRQKRRATLFDAVAGRVTKNGLVPEWAGFNGPQTARSRSRTNVRSPSTPYSATSSASSRRGSSQVSESAVSDLAESQDDRGDASISRDVSEPAATNETSDASSQPTVKPNPDKSKTGKGSRGPYRKRQRTVSRSRSRSSSRGLLRPAPLRRSTDFLGPFPQSNNPTSVLPFTTLGYEKRWRENQSVKLPKRYRKSRRIGEKDHGLRPLSADKLLFRKKNAPDVFEETNPYSADKWLQWARAEQNAHQAPGETESGGRTKQLYTPFEQWGIRRISNKIHDEGTWWYAPGVKRKEVYNNEPSSARKRQKHNYENASSPEVDSKDKPHDANRPADNSSSENPDLYRLPDSSLLKAIHAYASDYYAVHGQADADKYFKMFDETALLAFGILIEEQVREKLGENGDLVFTEGEIAPGMTDEDGVVVDDWGGLRTVGVGDDIFRTTRRRRDRRGSDVEEDSMDEDSADTSNEESESATTDSSSSSTRSSSSSADSSSIPQHPRSQASDENILLVSQQTAEATRSAHSESNLPPSDAQGHYMSGALPTGGQHSSPTPALRTEGNEATDSDSDSKSDPSDNDIETKITNPHPLNQTTNPPNPYSSSSSTSSKTSSSSSSSSPSIRGRSRAAAAPLPIGAQMDGTNDDVALDPVSESTSSSSPSSSSEEEKSSESESDSEDESSSS